MLGTHVQVRHIAFSLTLLVVIAATRSAAQDSPQGISSAARIYLEQALNLMQQHALNKSSLDWPHLRESTFARASHAKITADTYPAIVFALTQLKETHSFLQLPDSLPATQREVIA